MTIRSLLLLCCCPFWLVAQVAPKKPTSADIYDAVKKLNVLGSVLYVAAHPDDENTRLIAYMANEKKYQTTYLSLTRGDGGQNLIGTELRSFLGVLRTQELLMARSVDGGQQLFSRANDFGFSKSPAETMRIWNKQAVLADVVWAIRKTQPDVIINRFSTDTTVDTHGHHTASAMLSAEAFELAADPKAFPEQLKYVSVWQPKRLFFNTSWFFYGSQEAFDKADKSQMTQIDMGVFYPTKGKSNTEIAAESRSMHRCQGFGSLSSRGSAMEYLNYLKGIGTPKNNDILDGINTSWARVKGGAPIGALLAQIEKAFKLDNPAASVPALLKAQKMMQALPDGHWKKVKLEEINTVIRWCLGLYLEAAASVQTATQGQDIAVAVEALNRSNAKVRLVKMAFGHVRLRTENGLETSFFDVLKDTSVAANLLNNNKLNYKFNLKIPKNMPFSSPYWLTEMADLGMYKVETQALRGLPETPRPLQVQYEFDVEGVRFVWQTPVVNKLENPAKGEVYRPFEVTPSVFVNLAEKVYVFADNSPKEVRFIVKAGAENVKGLLKPQVPKGWQLQPEAQDFFLKQKGEEAVLTFKLTPPAGESEAVLKAQIYLPPQGAVTDNVAAEWQEMPTKSVRIIEYDHIPTQTVLFEAEAKIVKLNIVKHGTNIGYYMGAGDDMPACLAQIGYNVTLLTDQDFLSADGLKRFDAVVMGIRAYNTKEKLKFQNQKLLDYVQAGGTVVVQYNTNGRDLVLPNMGPYPFKIGRGRTTEEDAPIRFLQPDHVVLNAPNKITSKDFDHWVQERGLYFMSEWDSKYDAVLSCNDVGEKKEDGGLLVARHGKGYYVYSGYSFFRQLPEGVSGAYRLFANLLSIGKGAP